MSEAKHTAGPDPVEDAIQLAVEKYSNLNGTGHHVMVSRYDGFSSRPRHLKLHFDDIDPYVRVGKRTSQHRVYLKDMEGAKVINRATKHVVFYEIATHVDVRRTAKAGGRS